MSEQFLWEKLSAELTGLVKDVPAVAGLCVKDLTHGQTVEINADLEFPTASTIKVQIMAQLYRRAEKGELDLDRKVALTKELITPGSGVIAYFDDVETLTVRDIAGLMIQVSDNSATNLCIDWATIEGTNLMLRELGFAKTTLRRKMQDYDSVAAGLENISTPREMIGFVEILQKAERLSPFICSETLRHMRKWKRTYLSPGLPEDTAYSSKTGGMDRVRCEVGIVHQKRRPYGIAVFTKYGMQMPAAQEGFMAHVARTVHGHMATLDVVSVHGQGIPPKLLG